MSTLRANERARVADFFKDRFGKAAETNRQRQSGSDQPVLPNPFYPRDPRLKKENAGSRFTRDPAFSR
jgi:hypothetical protein